MKSFLDLGEVIIGRTEKNERKTKMLLADLQDIADVLVGGQLVEQIKEAKKEEREIAFREVYLCQVEKVVALAKAINRLKKQANLTPEEIEIFKYYE